MVDKISRARRWWIARRRLVRLQPLWQAICDVSPDVALDKPRPAWVDRLDPRDITYRLFRRIIEIRDGQLVLRPYLDAEVAAATRARLRARGVGETAEAVAIEAAVLRDALQSLALDTRPATVLTEKPRGADDLASEADWLIQVTRAFAKAGPA